MIDFCALLTFQIRPKKRWQRISHFAFGGKWNAFGRIGGKQYEI